MSRYLDRLTADARVQFQAVCKSRETPDCERELIALARMLPAMNPVMAAMVVANRFGEAEAPGVFDLLEVIRGDDDRDAEAV